MQRRRMISKKLPCDAISYPGVVVLRDTVDGPASQKKSQDCETGGRGSEMLERMSAHNRTDRIDLFVKEFQQLGQRVKHRSNYPIKCAGIFRREESENQDQCQKRKK